MRDELELIRLIENYLSGTMTEEERNRFRQRMLDEPALDEEVALQEQIVAGLDRAVLRDAANVAGRRFRIRKQVLRGTVLVLIIAVILAIEFYFFNRDAHGEINSLPEYNETGGREWVLADSVIRPEFFTIVTSRDTIIETKSGIVFSFAAGSFRDKNGTPLSGDVSVTIKEAMDPASILKAGLSTMSGNRQLETGGMFYLDFRQHGNTVHIDPAKPVYAQVPRGPGSEGMQLFEGKRTASGSIDWVNPRDFEKTLTAVDISTLDFYPPGYRAFVTGLGIGSGKVFLDSFYLSFSEWFRTGGAYPGYTMLDGPATDTGGHASDNPGPDTYWGNLHGCGIDPASVMAIWDARYNNTILATKEFEERLRLIHTIGNRELLQLYTQGMQSNLPFSAIDSFAMQYDGRFEKFAARKDGGLYLPDNRRKALLEYASIKQAAYSDAAIRARESFLKRINDTTGLAQDSQRSVEREIREAGMLMEEFRINLESAYAQLGYKPPLVPVSPADVFDVAITNPGWYNVDKYVMDATATRSSMEYTDTATGKKAIIAYRDLGITIPNPREYSSLHVYLVPDQQSSFLRITEAGGSWPARLNSLLGYTVVALGNKNGLWFYDSKKISNESRVTLSLHKENETELDKHLSAIKSFGAPAAFRMEIASMAFEVRQQSIARERQGDQEIRSRVGAVVFPCVSRLPMPPVADSLPAAGRLIGSSLEQRSSN
ncbi:MAG: hypothetical protein EOO09_05665 [Chitinophagaceae bacterium]|nr:MAG: hypothetical protein EOO09_05665 [Chitinophagaceae bacterium]